MSNSGIRFPAKSPRPPEYDSDWHHEVLVDLNYVMHGPEPGVQQKSIHWMATEDRGMIASAIIVSNAVKDVVARKEQLDAAHLVTLFGALLQARDVCPLAISAENYAKGHARTNEVLLADAFMNIVRHGDHTLVLPTSNEEVRGRQKVNAELLGPGLLRTLSEKFPADAEKRAPGPEIVPPDERRFVFHTLLETGLAIIREHGGRFHPATHQLLVDYATSLETDKNAAAAVAQLATVYESMCSMEVLADVRGVSDDSSPSGGSNGAPGSSKRNTPPRGGDSTPPSGSRLR